MKRRNFLAASTMTLAAASSFAAEESNKNAKQNYLELREYHFQTGQQRSQFNDFLRKAAIPSMNRLGIKPVGVFTAMYGPSQPSTYVLIPHADLQSVVTLNSRMGEDNEFRSAGESYLNASINSPSYNRYESSLMLAFSHMPTIEIPKAIEGKDSRVFELRIYESHSEIAAKKKIEMFNEGGEIAIFKNTGLDPVFFGETLIGPRMPNLTYMLAFENMAARDAAWNVFRVDPDWKKLSGDEQYRDTVSNITDYILRPASASQI